MLVNWNWRSSHYELVDPANCTGGPQAETFHNSREMEKNRGDFLRSASVFFAFTYFNFCNFNIVCCVFSAQFWDSFFNVILLMTQNWSCLFLWANCNLDVYIIFELLIGLANSSSRGMCSIVSCSGQEVIMFLWKNGSVGQSVHIWMRFLIRPLELLLMWDICQSVRFYFLDLKRLSQPQSGHTHYIHLPYCNSGLESFCAFHLVHRHDECKKITTQHFLWSANTGWRFVRRQGFWWYFIIFTLQTWRRFSMEKI